MNSNDVDGLPHSQNLQKQGKTGIRQHDPRPLKWSNISDSDSSSLQRDEEDTPRQENSKAVAIILGYYEGNSYLREQIRSILDQSHKNLEIFIADDCSHSKVDVTRLELTKEDAQKIWLAVRPKNVGFTSNFLGALGDVDEGFEYFAFSDQDDVWQYDKIEKALSILSQYPDDRPALYCGRTTATDATGQLDLGNSPLFAKPPSFANALVQSLGGGNTIVMNKAARDLVVKSANKATSAVSHDWWCYQIVSGAGGIVFYDPKPYLKYRQHAENQVGSNKSLAKRLVRIRSLMQGRFRKWNDVNLKILAKNRKLLASDNQQKLDDIIEARKSGLFKRLLLCRRSGIYRQTFLDNLGLLLGLIINRV